MKIRAFYQKVIPKGKFKISYDKKSKGRPAWIEIKNVPPEIRFISVHLGKKGKEGVRIQSYKTYLPEGLFLPIDYTKQEMKEFYNQWSKWYDSESKKPDVANLRAARFFLGRLKRYVQKTEMLDLGAGTGLITEMFVKEGYRPATLVDYSEGMLKQAKKKKGLKGCKFIKEDIRKLNLGRKFDLIISFFSFASSSYFNKEELDKIIGIVDKHLNKNGIFAVFGHFSKKEFKKKFKTLEEGVYTLNKEKKFYTDYFIGRKR